MVSKAKTLAQVDRARLLVHEDAVACLVVVDALAKSAPEPVLEQVRSILREATERIRGIVSAGESGTVVVNLSTRRRAEYFPNNGEGEEFKSREIDAAKTYWDQAVVEPTRFREEALAQVGPLLPPREVAERLGVSRATVANWRSQSKLLGVRFDDHEYRFPGWQFVLTPSEGERGVVQHLDDVLVALGDAHPWDKAKFFLTRVQSLGDRRPIDVLRSGSPDEVRLVVQLAGQRGQLGS